MINSDAITFRLSGRVTPEPEIYVLIVVPEDLAPGRYVYARQINFPADVGRSFTCTRRVPVQMVDGERRARGGART